MSIELVIYLYIYVCLCLVLFNVAYLVNSKRSKRFIENKRKKYKRLINRQLFLLEAEKPLDEIIQEKLFKNLKHLNTLIAFDSAFHQIKEFRSDMAQKYFDLSRGRWEQLTLFYAKRPNEEKAYFSYLMSVYKTSRVKDDDIIANCMISFINSQSAYVRENSLKSLYQMGNAQCVLRAYRVLNLKESYQNVKLLSDGLVSFKGDHSELMELLWDNFYRFSAPIQVSIVNYLRMKTDQYCDKLAPILDQDGIDKEVKLAVLRYYRKHYYEPIVEKLISFLMYEDENLWEFAAISASSLDHYPSVNTYQALCHALKSRNWYIRFNAADSLIKMGLTATQYLNDEHNTDKYAREMIQYRWKEQKSKNVH